MQSFNKKNGRYIGRYKNYDAYLNKIVKLSGENEGDINEKLPGEMVFNYGPSAGGLEESVNFKIITPGEKINSVRVDSSFKRRNIKILNNNIYDALLKIERINGYHSASNSICFLLAVENALNIENNESNNKRVIEIELERIRSNLHIVKGLTESAGFSVPEKQLSYLIEEVSRIISEAFKHRYFFGANYINNVRCNFNNLNENILKIKKEFLSIYEDLLASKIFMDRLQENGTVKDINSTGPAARASGYNYDARLDSRSLFYESYKIFTMNSGDVFSRFMVRSDEIFSSIELIENIKVKENINKDYDLNKSGSGNARIESPQGDLFYHLDIKDGKINDIIMVSPSYINIKLFEKAMRGNIFTDFFFVWESFGIWISEKEVNFI